MLAVGQQLQGAQAEAFLLREEPELYSLYMAARPVIERSFGQTPLTVLGDQEGARAIFLVDGSAERPEDFKRLIGLYRELESAQCAEVLVALAGG